MSSKLNLPYFIAKKERGVHNKCSNQLLVQSVSE